VAASAPRATRLLVDTEYQRAMARLARSTRRRSSACRCAVVVGANRQGSPSRVYPVLWRSAAMSLSVGVCSTVTVPSDRRIVSVIIWSLPVLNGRSTRGRLAPTRGRRRGLISPQLGQVQARLAASAVVPMPESQLVAVPLAYLRAAVVAAY